MGESISRVSGDVPTRSGVRIAIPAKIRFEVFKRDAFTCQYCGRQAPDVVLHVDHIIPVSKGGTNDLANLISACQDCNLGKGARPLSDLSAAERMRRELTLQQERLEQIRMIGLWQRDLLQARNAGLVEMQRFFESLAGGRSTLSDSFLATQGARLLKRFGLQAVLQGMQEAYESCGDPAKAVAGIERACIRNAGPGRGSLSRIARLAERSLTGVPKEELRNMLRLGIRLGGKEFCQNAAELLRSEKGSEWDAVRGRLYELASDGMD